LKDIPGNCDPTSPTEVFFDGSPVGVHLSGILKGAKNINKVLGDYMGRLVRKS
jgi:hypothetical protein